MATLILATGNEHKVEEIRGILGERFHYLTLIDFPNAPKVVEDAGSFAGNATKKALELTKWLAKTQPAISQLKGGEDVFVLADDSGLEVEALNGAPGIHSARFAVLDQRNATNS